METSTGEHEEVTCQVDGCAEEAWWWRGHTFYCDDHAEPDDPASETGGRHCSPECETCKDRWGW